MKLEIIVNDLTNKMKDAPVYDTAEYKEYMSEGNIDSHPLDSLLWIPLYQGVCMRLNFGLKTETK